MICGTIHSESPAEHWQHLNCGGKVILDLGCGFWTQEERDAGNGTAKYFIGQNPIKYIGADINSGDIQKLTKEFPQAVFNNQPIRYAKDILDLLNQYQPSVIKCDIEGMEDALFGLDHRHSICEVAIETHNGREKACLDWCASVGLNPWRFDSVSFCKGINVIYAKC